MGKSKWLDHIIIRLIESGQQDKRFKHTPPELESILGKREALPRAIKWMESKIDPSAYKDSSCDGVMIWENVGLHFRNKNRFFDAIIIFQRLYEHICKAELDIGNWIHKGMPLVWIRDCHKILGHRWLSARYLILTLVEDAIREHGIITPGKGGIYHRFCWEEGYSDEYFRKLSKKSYSIYDSNKEMGIFPEYILLQLGIDYLKCSATIHEADNYEVNKIFSEYLLKKLGEKGVDKTGKLLEIFASYILGCIPGFQVEERKKTKEYHFDGFLRTRGNYLDFRSDLGFYILVECKNWDKPIGVEEIGYFAHKLSVHDCSAGIIFSKFGTTGERSDKDTLYGVRTILKSYHHLGKIIMILKFDDFEKAAKGENLIRILRDKYEEVRFDLALTRTED